jgi:hypothetical protein
MSASQSPTDRRRAPYIAAAVACLAACLAPAFAGCSTPIPIVPKGAWAVSFIQPNAIDCQIANHNMAIGEVSADQRANLLEDGEDLTAGDDSTAVSVSCEVIANGGTFSFSASESANGAILSLSVPELSPSATKDKPSKGVVLYQSINTANSFSQSDCSFYFLKGQSVAEGEVFLTFDCDKIAASGGNVCQINPGYAAFEKCAVTKDQTN